MKPGCLVFLSRDDEVACSPRPRVSLRPSVMTAAMKYGVYLVTGRDLLPLGKDYLESLEESVRDGYVSIVQVRYVALH